MKIISTCSTGRLHHPQTIIPRLLPLLKCLFFGYITYIAAVTVFPGVNFPTYFASSVELSVTCTSSSGRINQKTVNLTLEAFKRPRYNYS